MKMRPNEISTKAGPHNTDAGAAWHLGLLHIEEGKDSVLGKVHNRFGVDSCLVAMGNHETTNLADSPGSTSALVAALHSLNPVRARRVDTGIGCGICPADTAPALTDRARMQPAHTQTQDLQGDGCYQKLEKTPGRRRGYHPYHRLHLPY